MAVSNNYDASTALSSYYPSRTSHSVARLWAIEKSVQDLAAVGLLECFEGPGPDPTALTGYSSAKIWLKQAAGVQPSSGGAYYWNGNSPATNESNWLQLTPPQYLRHLGALTSITGADYSSRAALALATVSAPQTFVRTAGYATVGDRGGGLYKRDVSLTTGGVQSADGAYWTLVPDSDGVNVFQTGAKADNTTNDAAAFSAAADIADTLGVRMRVPAGIYLISSAVSVPNGIQILGDSWQEQPTPAAGQGTWIRISGTGFTPFALSGTSTRGTRFKDIAFYQTQPNAGIGWTPTAYPHIIDAENMLGAVDIVDCYFCNVTNGIKSYNSGRTYLHRVKADVYQNLLTIDKCLDVPMIDDVHVWTFNNSQDTIRQYAQANLDVIKLGRVDSPTIGKIFVFGARSALRFFNGGDGVATKVMAASLQVDFTKYAIYVDGTAHNTSFDVGTLQHQGEAWSSAGSAISGAAAVRIDGRACRGSIARLALAVATYGLDFAETTDGSLITVGSARMTSGTNLIKTVSTSGNAHIVQLATTPFLEGGATLQNSGTTGVVSFGGTGSTLGTPGWNWSYDSSGGRFTMQVGGSTSLGVNMFGAGVGKDISLGMDGWKVIRCDIAASKDSTLLARSIIAGVSLIVESSSTDANLALTPKGAGAVAIPGQYNSGPMKINGNYLWVDGSGKLRIKGSAPSTDTDGTIVGTQS